MAWPRSIAAGFPRHPGRSRHDERRPRIHQNQCHETRNDIMQTGFIGIGAMGWHMASNLCRAGHQVSVHDADPARHQRFAREHNAHATPSLAELGARVDVVITMLADRADRPTCARAAGGRGAGEDAAQRRHRRRHELLRAGRHPRGLRRGSDGAASP